jgi:hypothetical protein
VPSCASNALRAAARVAGSEVVAQGNWDSRQAVAKKRDSVKYDSKSPSLVRPSRRRVRSRSRARRWTYGAASPRASDASAAGRSARSTGSTSLYSRPYSTDRSVVRTRVIRLRPTATSAASGRSSCAIAPNSAAPASATVFAHGPVAHASRSTRGIAWIRPRFKKSIGPTPSGESSTTAAVCCGKRRAYSPATLVP